MAFLRFKFFGYCVWDEKMLTSLIRRTKSLVGIGESPVGNKIAVMDHNCTKNTVVTNELQNGTIYKNNNLKENIYGK